MKNSRACHCIPSITSESYLPRLPGKKITLFRKYRENPDLSLVRITAIVCTLLAIGPGPLAWAGPAPVTSTSSSATVTGSSPVTMHFPLLRSGDNAYATWIHYATQNGTAIAGTDYTAASGRVKVPAGATGASIPVQVLGASGYSPDKQFTLNLSSAVGVGPTPAFAAQQSFAVGQDPYSEALADLNGDGKPDLVTANHNSGSLSVRLNTTAPGASSASFGTAKTLAEGGAYAVTTADVNGDGKPDLIALDASGVSVWLNTTAPGASTPTFASPQSFAVGSGPTSVTAADVNGNGKPDLIVTNYSANTVSVLLNTTAAGASTPSFAAQQTFAVGSGPDSVTAADVNGDGKPDLVVANESGNTVSVLLNTTAAGASTPSFATQQTFAVGSGPDSVTAVDVNGDGKPDLIVTNYSANTVSALLNTTAAGASTPSFAAQQTFAVGSAPASVTAADVNGDGKPDLVVANEGANTVSVLLDTTAPGASSANFVAKQTFATGSRPDAIETADLNGDGRADVVAANQSSSSVSVLLNTTAAPTASAPSFAAQKSFTTGNLPPSVTAADVNGDGKLDLVVANTGSNTVSVLLNTTAPGASTPSFATQQAFATGTYPYSVTTADVNGDGKPDLIVANGGSNTVSVLLNTTAPGASTLSFAAQQTFATGSTPYSVTAADVNGDGTSDLIVANDFSDTVSVLLNTTTPGASTPSFAAQQTFGTGNLPQSVTTADVNGDGKPDLIVANTNGKTVSVYLNTTTPGATTPAFSAQQTFATGSGPQSVATADMNGDGKPDLIVANNSSNTVSVLLNTTTPGATTPSFAAQQSFATGSLPDSVTAADVNGDGKPDLIVANNSSNTVSVLLNTTVPGATTPSLSAQHAFATGSLPRSATVADVNGDGTADLILANYNSNNISVLTNTQFAASVSPAAVTGTIHYAIPQVSFASSPLAFGNVVVGNTSTKTETLSNTGGASLSIASIAISGTNAARYSQSNNCPASLAVGASCAIHVSYSPGAPTTDSATLSVSSNVPSSPDTVALSGTGTDTAPTASNASFSTTVNTVYSGQLQATNPNSGQTLTYSVVTGPAHGNVSVNGSTGAYTYTPASGYVGSDSFTFKANDGYKDSNTATVSVTVADTPPVARNGSYPIKANGSLSGQLQATAASSSQTLTYALVSRPAHGSVSVNASTGQFTYTPDHDYTGSDSFTFKASDGTLDSNTATVTLKVAAGSLARRSAVGGGGFGPWGLALLGGLALLAALLRRKSEGGNPRSGAAKPAALALGLVLAGSVLFAASPARAAGAGPWYGGVQLNVIQPAGGRHSATAGFKGWTLLFGRHLGRHFALEIDRASYSDNPETLTATANWVNWGLRGLYFPWRSQGAFAPFVLAGVGHQYEYRGDNSEPSNNSASLGLGFTSQPWAAPVAIRADLEVQHGFGGGYNDKIFNLGVVFHFGH